MKLVALVAGGASGIGLATVQILAKDGDEVFMLDLPQTKGQEEADKLGPSVSFVATDVTKEVDVANAVSLVKKQFGRLDVVVSCAGIAIPQPIFDPKIPVSEVLEVFNKVYQVNLFGTYNVVCQAGRLMTQNEPDEEGGRGVIINISSIYRDKSPATFSAYGASKGGVAGLTNPLTQELAPYGIRVVEIAPGPIDTPLLHGAFQAESLEALTKTIPFPSRHGKPAEIASTIAHIVSNKYISGTAIHINAGLGTN